MALRVNPLKQFDSLVVHIVIVAIGTTAHFELLDQLLLQLERFVVNSNDESLRVVKLLAVDKVEVPVQELEHLDDQQDLKDIARQDNRLQIVLDRSDDGLLLARMATARLIRGNGNGGHGSRLANYHGRSGSRSSSGLVSSLGGETSRATNGRHCVSSSERAGLRSWCIDVSIFNKVEKLDSLIF